MYFGTITVLRNYSKEKVPNLGTFFISNNCTGCADASGPNVHTWRTSVLDRNHPVFQLLIGIKFPQTSYPPTPVHC